MMEAQALPTPVPAAPEAERSVIGQILRGGSEVAGEVVATLLTPEDFYQPDHKLIFEAIAYAYAEGLPMDSLSIAERVAPTLTKLWNCPEQHVILRVTEIEQAVEFAGKIGDHAQLVTIESNRRKLLGVADSIRAEVASERLTPEEIASMVSKSALEVATSGVRRHEIVSFADIGRRYIPKLIRQRILREEGIETGAYFGLPFLDNHLKGLKPGECLMGAGEPGVGKSAVFWTAARRFAERQTKKPADRRVGAFVLSLEMDEDPTDIRLAQSITGLDGGRLREAKVTDAEIQAIRTQWGRRKEIPLWFNFTSSLRASQLRAVIVEAIHQHNIGLVVIDHFKNWHLDKRLNSPVQEDEDKAEFLSQAIAKDLNVAVICIAHTTKGVENAADRRPQLTHLRGSYQVAAQMDWVTFVYRPFDHADEDKKLTGAVKETDAELIYRKARHNFNGIVPFHFDPVAMKIE
jgi:replicative DNA helicase